MGATTSNNLAIDLRDVVKIYKGKVHALQGIEMRVNRGEVFGLLGPNGAGKSTLVKIMMTVIRPTAVHGTILGQPVGHKATLQRVGYLPEAHRFPRYLTGRQTLEFFGALQKVNRPSRKRRAAELLDVVGMSAWADKKSSTYSKGMTQRIGLAQALVADPDLVVLDEPTDGVDPVGRRDIRDVLLRLKQQNKTVFVNSHLLSELEMICDRVAILVQGRVAKQGTLDELTRDQQRYDIEIEGVSAAETAAHRERIVAAIPAKMTEMKSAVPSSSGPPRLPMSVAPPLPSAPLTYGGGLPPMLPPSAPAAVPLPTLRGELDGGTWVELDGTLLRVGTTDSARIQPLLDTLRRAGLILRRVQPFRQSLEDLFMEAVTDPTTGQAVAPGAQRSPAGRAIQGGYRP